MTSKNETSEVETWNQMSMTLIQAMVGAISPNFRQVTLSRTNRQWQLGFVLADDSDLDREEIDDIGFEFEALQDGPVDYDILVLVSQAELTAPAPPARVLFRRREHS